MNNSRFHYTKEQLADVTLEDLRRLAAAQSLSSFAVLVSGDPFHFGAGASLARHLEPGEWRNYPQASTFAWIAGELGWSQERTHCLGLHARSLSSLTPLLAPQERFICLVRDGPAGHTLAQWLLQGRSGAAVGPQAF